MAGNWNLIRKFGNNGNENESTENGKGNRYIWEWERIKNPFLQSCICSLRDTLAM